MKTNHLMAAGVLALTTTVRADTFGSGGNTFNIGFVDVGNAGNANDTTGYGGVPYGTAEQRALRAEVI